MIALPTQRPTGQNLSVDLGRDFQTRGVGTARREFEPEDGVDRQQPVVVAPTQDVAYFSAPGRRVKTLADLAQLNVHASKKATRVLRLEGQPFQARFQAGRIKAATRGKGRGDIKPDLQGLGQAT